MKKIVLVLAAALALASCAKQESIRSAQPGEVRFTTNIQTYTVKATDTAFENNDQVGIFAGAPISKNNVQAAVSGTSLIPVTPIKWVDGNSNLVDFVAYYPYAAAATLTDYAFAVEANQSVLANYKKSDLMLAKTSSAPVETAVNLAFSHALSKVVITLTNNVPETTVSRVEFEGVALGAKVNLSTGALSELGSNGTITANAVSETAYQLILLPQSATPKVNVFLSNNLKYTYELASAFTFKAGKKASAALVVDPQQEAGAAVFSFTVADWVVDTDALEFDDPTVEVAESWVVTGKINGKTSWDDPAVVTMTENEFGDFEADITWTEDGEFKLHKGDLWVGMKPGWTGYALGDFGNDTNYLADGDEALNIVLEAPVGEYHLYFDPENYWFVVSSKDTDPSEDPQTGKLTVNVYNGPAWNPLYFYSWIEADPWPHFTADWPGTAAAAEDVVVGENAFKSFVMDAAPLNADNIFYILSDGTDAHKTINLKFPVVLTEAQTTVYLELKPDGSVALIENPASFVPTAAPDPAEGPVWSLIGLASDWNTEHEMTQDTEDENLWTITVTLGAEAAEKDGFKFKLKGENWDVQFGVDPQAETNEFEITEADQVINLVANQGTSKNIIIKPFAYQYKLKLYVDGENKGKLLVTKL